MLRFMSVLTGCALLASAAVAQDISTVTTDSGRYLSVLGKDGGGTSAPWWAPGEGSGPTGIHDIASNGGNAAQGWVMTDGDPMSGNFVTWGPGQDLAGPHYQGMKFKKAATVTGFHWANVSFGDGGTFAATPTVEVYDRGADSWTPVAATWATPYDGTFDAGVVEYDVTLDTPATVDGVRLSGAATASPGPYAFVATSELAVKGSVDWGVDLANDLTDLPGATGIASHSQFDVANLIDNDLNTLTTTVFAEQNGVPSDEDFVGAAFADSQNAVGAIGVVFKRFGDGGFLDTITVETYDAGADTWTPVTGLDTGSYFDDYAALTALPWDTEVGYLFTFDRVDGVDAVRVFGAGWGTAFGDGFLAASEVEVFAVPEPTALLLIAIGGLMLRRR